MSRSTSSRKQHSERLRLTMPLSVSNFLLAVTLFLAFSLSNAQVPIVDTCTCSPTDFAFRLNFTATCDESDVIPSDAIQRVRCIVSDPVFQPVEPDVATVITQIDILEFGRNLTLLSSTTYRGPYDDGDTFDFTRCVEYVM